MNSEDSFKSGFIALAGRPNAGKSTLVNAVMGRKLLITSDTAQTTRHRFRAVLDGDGYQLILVDTPGIHKPKDLLGVELNTTAENALTDVDAIAWVVDAMAPLGTGDKWVSDIIAKTALPCILVLNKSDLVSPEELEAQRLAAQAMLNTVGSIALSALQKTNIEEFIQLAASMLPQGPRWFPEGIGTDQPLEVIIAEFIREKVLLQTFDEVPHSIGVVVNELEHFAKRKFYRIEATIFVERESQKGIVVGKGGKQIREIGSMARVDLQHFLAANIYLDLRVKLRKGWRRDLASIHRFGYGEGVR